MMTEPVPATTATPQGQERAMMGDESRRPSFMQVTCWPLDNSRDPGGLGGGRIKEEDMLSASVWSKIRQGRTLESD